MQSLNFGFLTPHDDRLTALGGLAERYFCDDPSTAIAKLRQFAEQIAKLVAARNAVYLSERESFEEILHRLSRDGTGARQACQHNGSGLSNTEKPWAESSG
ncbi:MAG: hypothetical protein LBG44_11415 [Gemmatimonadota bacterium]|nr:hypothetical protein [Gemmatimonadota bacterium]